MSWILDLPKFEQEEISELKDYGFYKQNAQVVLTANLLLKEFDTVTVRQLYYQFVARGYIVNTAKSYQNFVKMLTKARELNLIDWQNFEDRARRIEGNYKNYSITKSYDPTKYAKEQVVSSFNPIKWTPDKWTDQEKYVEVWIEKDALAGLFAPVCEEWGLPLIISRGFTSVTYRKLAEKRMKEADKPCTLLYFGDLDPSGMAISDVLKNELSCNHVEVIRPALNVEQVSELNLTSAPTKDTDSRTNEFNKRFPSLNGECYELDAMHPKKLQELLTNSIQSNFDEDVHNKAISEWKEWQHKYEEELSNMKKRLDL